MEISYARPWDSSISSRIAKPNILAATCWLLVGIMLAFGAKSAYAADPLECGDRTLQVTLPDDPPDLTVTGNCLVPIGYKLYFRNVNILKGGKLAFHEGFAMYRTETHFWASSIIIENGGALVADGGNGMDVGFKRPYGYITNGTLTIHLYGSNEAKWNRAAQKFDVQNAGAPCKTPQDNTTVGPCGIPLKNDQGVNVWENNGKDVLNLPGKVRDRFYQYGALYGDARCKDPDNLNSKTVVFHEGQCKANNGDGPVVPKAKLEGYFGNKVLAVSYGGTLDLAGKKGALYDDPRDDDPLFSGDSWMRLEDRRSLERDASILYLERSPRTGWNYGDEIVLTTTDYLPGHTEKLRILPADAGQHSVVFEAVESPTKKLQWPHNGVRYGGPGDSGGYQPWQEKLNQWPKRLEDPRILAQLDPELVNNGAETRAAVALLTRSIRIVSAGDVSGADFGHHTAKDGASTDPEDPTYSFGGHLVIRQGFERVQIQGVEFKQMGQGGRLAHYPVHFHMARKTPDKTYIKDSSINESMTRWIVIHSTQGVTVARNVGYKSIGHGFYLEDGTETDNKFHSNIGILARAAIRNPVHNPRSVPGILADNQGPASFTYPQLPNPAFPYRSDVEHPTIFWIANGWNDFIGNMAAGAGACGAAYWLVPSTNSDHIEVPTAGHQHDEQMEWTGYAGLQKPAIDPITKKKLPGNGGATPLKSFFKNYATSTMYSFQTTPDAPECLGFISADTTAPSNLPTVQAVPSDSPKPLRTKNDKGEEIADNQNDPFYPHVIGGARRPTECISKGGGEYDCVGDSTTHKVLPCASNAPNNADCTVTVLDHFTSSFHWAHGNASAIWLRPYWYLLTNSVITDVQNGGLTFVSGGDYTRASAIEGYWALAKSSIFIGRTNNSPYASTTGPTYMGSAEDRYNVRCARLTTEVPPYCLLPDHGISMPTGGFFTNQRLTNIYDGPSYQDSNVYLDITTADCERWPTPDKPTSCIYGSTQSLLVLKRKPDKQPPTCYLPNAAIGWKQPNGFYYPPAFHSKNLFFDNVQLRHFVIAPMFSMLDKERDGITPVPRKYDFGQGGTYHTNNDKVHEQYCITNDGIFDNWTSIDRQTELNDDDGSLTGLSNSLSGGPLQQTISINEDTFFAAPVETPECGSADGPNTLPANACKAPDPNQSPVTARTSPYDYLTTVIYHRQEDDTPEEKPLWGSDCAHETCYGVPLYRQYLTGDKTGSGTREWKQWYANECGKAENLSKVQCRWPFIRMSGLDLAQRQTLTINNGVYYVDTTVSEKTQRAENFSTAAAGGRTLNVFKAGKTYYMFFVYAKNSTKQTYHLYVGKNFKTDPDSDARGFKPGRMNIDTKTLVFTPLPKEQAKTTKWATSHLDGDGMLKVTIDFTTATDLAPTPGNGLCQPRKFCQPSGNSCVLKTDSPLLAANKDFAKQNADVCSWAVKDLDCPPGGCYGFSFTLVDAVDDDIFRRPKDVDSFPTTSDDTQGEPKWGTKFAPYVQRPDVKPDMCIYKSVPGTDCKVP